MVRASLVVRGKNLTESLNSILNKYHKKEKTVRYDLDSGVVFMFDQFDWFSNSTYSLSVIRDDSKVDKTNESIEIQCFVLGGKVGLLQLDTFKREKACLGKFQDDLEKHSRINELNWTFEDLIYL